MCDKNIPSVTLQTAVIMVVKEFAEKNTTFSCHDITRNIREKTSSGLLEIPEVETSDTNSQIRFDISHVKVKALFDELWNTGAFDATFSLTRNFNGMYFEYEPLIVVNASTPFNINIPQSQSTITASTSKNDNTHYTPYTTSQLAAAIGTAIASTSNDDNTPQSNPTTQRDMAVDRINTYLRNCKTKGIFNPTIKQIQSAIKRRNLIYNPTCEEIQKIITNDLMYVIIPDPYVSSKSKVTLDYKSNG